jgi:putative FmdB family regulatory protein
LQDRKDAVRVVWAVAALEEIRAAKYFRDMPIYEFHCNACEQDSEVLVRSTDWKGTPCPKCGSTKLEKKLSVFASSVAGQTSDGPSCSGQPSSCGLCGTGKAHSH